MVITFSVGGSVSGPRPIDPNRDFPQLASLLKTVFRDELDSNGQRAFDSAVVANKPALLWRLDPFLARLTPGFVWEEDGRIVGNVTLLPTSLPRRWIIANVAVFPAYRRHGIARALMEAAQREAQKRGAYEIRLQVDSDNNSAKDLYSSLGYSTLGTLKTWNLVSSRSRFPDNDLYAIDEQADVIEMPRSRWRDAYKLDLATGQADLCWPDPLPGDAYRRNLRRRLADFLGGKHFEIWMAGGESAELRGFATINGEWGKIHQLRVRVHPDSRGELEQVLILKLLRRLYYLPRRGVRMFHDADDPVMNELLPSLRFRDSRTLTQMRLALK
ncbi:MAG: GNAT family N-acetyltransferase [Candidatus Promineifilaceae bacterium]